MSALASRIQGIGIRHSAPVMNSIDMFIKSPLIAALIRPGAHYLVVPCRGVSFPPSSLSIAASKLNEHSATQIDLLVNHFSC